jgi:spermidine synthase
MNRWLGWTLAFGVGFLSLGQEILWVRLVSFMLQGMPQAFSAVLCLFLLGIAFGAIAGKRLSNSPWMIEYTALVLLVGGGLDVLLPSVLVQIRVKDELGWLLGSLIVVTAALKAVIFPIAHQLGSDVGGQRLGRSVSRVYCLNILGSTLGPIVTGFWLMDHAGVDTLMRATGAAVLALALFTTLVARRRWLFSAVALFGLGGALWTAAASEDDHRLVRAVIGKPPVMVIENRQGIIHVMPGGEEGDVVLGGNVYDGRINIDLVKNGNRIDRMYLLAALHPQPRKVLVIGLSGGAWTRTLSLVPDIQRIDVVEINPGYLEVIRHYPEVNPILSDPHIQIHIDDGRRWLRRHPEARYDLIVMNTTFHWRAYSTNLLSKEFMQIVQRSLAPGGIMAFNTTGSPEALRTAMEAFPHAYRWSNFVYASDHDFRSDMPRVAERLLDLRQRAGGSFLAGEDQAVAEAVGKLTTRPFIDLAKERNIAGREPEVITDDNMITEYRHGRTLW